MSHVTASFAAFEPQVARHAMRRGHTPTDGLGYWTTLSIASVLGANTGDLLAAAFGALPGMPLLAAAFAGILWAERRSTRPTQAYYWAGILLVRAAATNAADLLGHAFGPLALAGVGAALVATIATQAEKQSASADFPTVDALYWGRMLLAGALGTALGDFSSYMSGLGPNLATLALGAAVAATIGLRSFGLLASTFAYWGTVIGVRAAGTALGDLTAGHLGLAQSAAVWAVALLVALFFRAKRPMAIVPRIA